MNAAYKRALSKAQWEGRQARRQFISEKGHPCYSAGLDKPLETRALIDAWLAGWRKENGRIRKEG